MSTETGQSREHALQDRHRSSASCTSGARQPPVTSEPFASSCSTRARPRVESFSSRVARNDGHMNPPAAPLSARHLAIPTHRCTAADRSPPSAASANPPAARSGRASASRRSPSTGAGPTMTPGFSSPSGSNRALNAANASIACREYMIGSSSLRARPSPCSPDSEPPYPATRWAASVRNGRIRSA